MSAKHQTDEFDTRDIGLADQVEYAVPIPAPAYQAPRPIAPPMPRKKKDDRFPGFVTVSEVFPEVIREPRNDDERMILLDAGLEVFCRNVDTRRAAEATAQTAPTGSK